MLGACGSLLFPHISLLIKAKYVCYLWFPKVKVSISQLYFPNNVLLLVHEVRIPGQMILFSQGRGYLNLSKPNVEIFDCRLGRKRLRPNICFPLPRFTHAPYGLERSRNHGGQREQAKAGWISLFCLQISFVLACFWSIEPLKILWYQSKRK